MKRSVKQVMLYHNCDHGGFVFTGKAAVRVFPQPSASVGGLLSNADLEAPVVDVGAQDPIRPMGSLTFTGGTNESISLANCRRHLSCRRRFSREGDRAMRIW